jgi:glycosyltransferase involved in cell wall biosynthesis
MVLSILIPTIDIRVEDKRFFSRLMQRLIEQVKSGSYENQVEIIVCFDCRKASIGSKRNFLMEKSNGEFLCFVDDDDDVSDDYVKNIVEAITNHPDIDYVGWKQLYIESGRVADKYTYHSLKHKYWSVDGDGWYRNVSHLNPIRSSIAKQVPFLDISHVEDMYWAEEIYPLLTSEAYIDHLMYYYRYETYTTMSRVTNNFVNHNYDIPYQQVFETYQENFIKYYINPQL